MTNKNFNQIYKHLNTQQKKAVDTIDGPVMVIAGPGTGKTQVLTARIANILKKTDTPPWAILALTFTDSASQEMKRRLVEMIGPDAFLVNIYTFHSFCSEIIRTNPDKFIISLELEPLSGLERIRAFRIIIDQHRFKYLKPFNAPYYYVPAIIKAIQDLKRENILPEEFEKILEKQEQSKDLLKNQELLKIYRLYQKELTNLGRYDFEDMINLAVEALRNDEELLRSYQERLHYILVDEYQDTNSAQNEFIKILGSFWGPKANVFVVGDDEQSIFRFQGASLENTLYFKKLYPQAEVIVLNTSYRSHQLILDAARRLISKNELKIKDYIKGVNKKIKSALPLKPSKIRLLEFSSGTSESYFVTSKIKSLLEKGATPNEIAVIYRNNADSQEISQMLDKFGIKYNLEGGENILSNVTIKKLIYLFKVIANSPTKDEDCDLFTLLNYEFLDFEALDVLKLSRFASEKRLSFFEAVFTKDFKKMFSPEAKEKRAKGTGGIGEQQQDKFRRFFKNLAHWQKAGSNKSFVNFFEQVIHESGYLESLLQAEDKIDKLNKLNSLFAEVKRLNSSDHSLNLQKFLADLELIEESNIKITEEDLDIDTQAVRLMTAHRAKGLEYDTVFIYQCVDKKWGNLTKRELIRLPEAILENLDLSKKEKNEDERRLFYVALTRAKKSIFITWAKSYHQTGRLKTTAPSMFVSEIPKNFVKQVAVKKLEKDALPFFEKLFKPASDTQVTIKEKEYLKPKVTDLKLSVTSLNTYLACPYRFKLNTLYRVPRAKEKYLSLGTAVHKALEVYFRTYIATNKKSSFATLKKAFLKALDKEILTVEVADDLKERGVIILKDYFESYYQSFIKPLATEKIFGRGFSRPYLDNIPLTGKIDRIDWLDKDKKEVLLIDYKTGKIKSRNVIEGKTKNSDGSYKRQLVFYKLLALLDKNFNLKVVKCRLDFIGDGKGKLKQQDFEIADQEVSELKKTIRQAMSKIRAFKFLRTSDYQHCTFCPFSHHCWPAGVPK